MDERIIKAKVYKQTLSLSSNIAGVAGEANSTAFEIEFDPTWDGYAKKIIWLDFYGKNPVEILLLPENRIDDDDDETPPANSKYRTFIPAEPLRHEGFCYVGIFGYKDGQPTAIQKSVQAKLTVERGVAHGCGHSPDDIPTDIIAQLQTAAENAEHNALLAKSWTVGKTGLRDDENFNNAKYWAEHPDLSFIDQYFILSDTLPDKPYKIWFEDEGETSETPSNPEDREVMIWTSPYDPDAEYTTETEIDGALIEETWDNARPDSGNVLIV